MKYKQKMTFLRAATIFGVATGYFFLLLFALLPFLKSNFLLNPSLYWFFTGYFLFVPLFLYSVIMVRHEGNKSIKALIQALNIKKLSYKDWRYAIIGTILIFLFTGFIFGCSFLLNKYFGIRVLNTTPWFMEEMRPFQGIEKLLLLVWFPMFFFNIVGEEILWRGYIQNRMEGKYTWLLCSFLWSVFHIPFGFDIIIMALPALLIIPYIFYKRNNTLIAIIIHGVYNGPLFILIALGLIK
ncbi:CPBP family intramembrane metalloprotease [candidate division WOR-3 bacterium]|nr:CPBP family intramembrane metalloprotease [candidate division WOR-3 bacterium]